ncbi:putative UDP-rhamnose:rhamnosyltransferase 1 [Salvia miltiorrhiza]|uniref:putative UDP-rhamnose:rhamnosyltransferase 1 n=1 Tax=Salvia miltiorrhiza TaxID=226208 RepID=UPI0025AD00D8|nr:putative UDP-rhamnose:rhamnosyltransferase 1 [Salvia miltiorrhiza]
MNKDGRRMSEENEVHVVMLPWLAFGHMIPFLDLSIALAKFGIHVSYISTPQNIPRLPQIPPNLSQFIEFVPLPLPSLDSDPLPENAEATTDIPAERMDDLKIACDLLQEPIKNVIAEKSPSWIMVDFFHHWAVDIAQELDIPLIFFSISTASTLVFFWSPEFLAGEGRRQARPSPANMMAPPDWVDFPSQVACRNDHEAVVMHNQLYRAGASGIEDAARLAKLIQGSHALALRSCVELEGDYLKVYSNITGKPVFPVGCLPPAEKEEEEKRVVAEEPWSKIFDWLDKQEPTSVIFVGFGSEYKLQREEIHEIAYGIELSGLPFLFVVRKPDWAGDVDDQILPPGFEARVAGRGVVQVGWAPQREILAHPSIGASLFHAGWTSVVEAMVHGHRLVLLPFIIAQPLDSRLLVEKGLAVEVERGEDGSFTRNGIANALTKAMVSKEGETLRARNKEAAKEIFANKQLNNDYIKKFAEYLKNGIKENKL